MAQQKTSRFGRRLAPFVAVACLMLGACSSSISVGGTAATPPVEGATTTISEDAGDGGSASTIPSETTTSAGTVDYVPAVVPVEEPPFEEVTITTEDGLDLFARYWPGGSTAVLYTHMIQTQLSGPQDSTSLGPYPWGLVEAGYTVLTPDFRGHGQSPGVAFANDSKADIEAAYQFLVDEGYETIVALAVWGSGPVLVNVDAQSDDVDFDGIALLFPSLSRNGNDLVADLPAIDEPVYVMHIDGGSSGGIPNRLKPYINDLWDAFVFPRVPSGQTFIDVYGADFLGRLIAFVDEASS